MPTRLRDANKKNHFKGWEKLARINIYSSIESSSLHYAANTENKQLEIL